MYQTGYILKREPDLVTWPNGSNDLEDWGEVVTFCSFQKENDNKDTVDNHHSTAPRAFLSEATTTSTSIMHLMLWSPGLTDEATEA